MGNVTPFPSAAARPSQIGFDRIELTRILDLYGRMVAAGHWKDYAIELGHEAAVFAAFRRASERPEYRIEKRPALRQRNGMWAPVAEARLPLNSGHMTGERVVEYACVGWVSLSGQPQ